MLLNNKDLKRFSKQIILKNVGIIGQKKIKSAKVLIIGAGGLGCPLILYLASSGVGNIGIVDYDKVDISNLHRQTLFTDKDVGKFKVTQAKKFINKINSSIKVSIFRKKIVQKNVNKIINNFDIICDGTDNFLSRYLINDQCLKMKKTLISAAISKFDGQLFKFDFKKKNSPCFRCFMPQMPVLENSCDAEGIISPLAGIMGTLQANEVIKTILNMRDDMSGKMLIFDALKTDFRKLKILRNSNCKNRC